MQLFEPLLTMPVLPATVLLALVVVWSLFSIVGGTLLHGHHVHVEGDLHGDTPDFFTSMGSVALRWLNLSEMPVMIWLSIFALLWWSVSVIGLMAFDLPIFGKPGPWLSILCLIRNILIALGLTKLVTRPFRGWYLSESIVSQSLVGQECEICSLEATSQYGQVRFKTDGAPLLLNVRTDGPDLPKGTRVWITHYDAARRAYIVSPTSQGN